MRFRSFPEFEGLALRRFHTFVLDGYIAHVVGEIHTHGSDSTLSPLWYSLHPEGEPPVADSFERLSST